MRRHFMEVNINKYMDSLTRLNNDSCYAGTGSRQPTGPQTVTLSIAILVHRPKYNFRRIITDLITNPPSFQWLTIGRSAINDS